MEPGRLKTTASRRQPSRRYQPYPCSSSSSSAGSSSSVHFGPYSAATNFKNEEDCRELVTMQHLGFPGAALPTALHAHIAGPAGIRTSHLVVSTGLPTLCDSRCHVCFSSGENSFSICASEVIVI